MFEWITEMSDPNRTKVVSIFFFTALAFIPLGALMTRWGDEEWYYRRRRRGKKVARIGMYSITLAASFSAALFILIVIKGLSS